MTITYRDSAQSGSNLTTYTFSAMAIGTADASRVVYVAVAGRAAGGDDTSINSLTIGGVTATEQVAQHDANVGDNILAIFTATVPTGTTADVVVTFSRQQVRAGAFTYTSTDTSGTAASTGQALSNDPSVTLSRSTGGTIALQLTGDSVIWTWTGATEDASETIEGVIELSAATATADTISTDAQAESGLTPSLIVATFPLAASPKSSFFQLTAV